MKTYLRKLPACRYKLRTTCLGLLLGFTYLANAETAFTVRHLANEQNIIVVRSAPPYLFLPVEDRAPDSRIEIIIDNRVVEGMNVRLAREKTDYYIPLDLTKYRGKYLSLYVQGVPAGAVGWKEIKSTGNLKELDAEKFRPAYHHAPVYGWMNDPNGMFYKDGVYHLYYQYNPFGSTWGNIHWGHSTSEDLVRWKPEKIVLRPDAWGAVFSGSCVVDYQNTAGFGAGAVIAFYTSAKPTPQGDCQTQSMAYSLDDGYTFTPYPFNPVLTSAERDFRDPKVFWHAESERWIMVLAVGQKMQIYSSANLKNWTYESEFGEGQGAHGGVWECPDLIRLPVKGTKEEKWVLIGNLNPGGPSGGSATQYFVGSFDGRKFANESAPSVIKWMDRGKDHYATVTWSHAPENRKIALAWMSNWEYANEVPSSPFRNANSVPRDLYLYREKGETYLASVPSEELKTLRGEAVEKGKYEVNGTCDAGTLLPANNGAYEMELTVKNKSAKEFGFRLSNSKGETLSFSYHPDEGRFSMDRTKSGLTGFSKNFPAVTTAPIGKQKLYKLRLFVDKASAEAFDGDGKFAMTNLIFPREPYNRVVFYSKDGSCAVTSLTVYPLNK